MAAWTEFRFVESDPQNENAHYQRVLGYVHTLNAPFFDEYLFPDALKLKAVTYYFNCRYDSAKRTVDEFNARYPATKQKLMEVLAQAPEDFQFYDLAKQILEGKSGLDPFVEKVAARSLDDLTMQRYFAYAEELEVEQAAIKGTSNKFQSAAVGDTIAVDLELSISEAKEVTGALARKRLQDRIDQIAEL